MLTTKEKPADRVDDPDLAEKMKMEIESIFLWAFAGLQRLAANNFKFTESQRTRETGRPSSGTTIMCSIFWNPRAISG